jgi:NADH dehydrogenase [ubiquinone] 1 alpha subcomplex assembly factor 7
VTPLERALLERIRSEGPISVEAFMDACNAYYYATRDPLGERGDFTTAPEISQMFGEMIGACLADAWRRSGERPDAIYAELGPGRGTLAADALRVLGRAGFAGEVHLVETSPVLRQTQRASLPGAIWHEAILGLPSHPLLLVANEFLDALPVRQFIAGAERHVQIEDGKLAFDLDGDIVEDSPARDQAVREVANHLAQYGGLALFIDYGHDKTAPGETLQAVRGHSFAPVLEQPGEQDLTAHVDFEALARICTETGVVVTAIAGQGEWLARIGIEARAGALMRANPSRAKDVEAALRRLTSREEMGTLFKVIGIHSADWQPPAGF